MKDHRIKRLLPALVLMTALVIFAASPAFASAATGGSFGSGFSTKLNMLAEWSQRFSFSLSAEYTRLFTWKSYEEANYKPEIHKTATQGDAGNTWMMVISPRLDIKIAGPCWLSLSGDYLLRHTNYKYHPHAASNTRDLRIGLKYQL